MAIVSLHVAGYRSIRDVRIKLNPINVLVGPNGCGKTNLYRATYLLAAAAGGHLAQTLAEEGGMPSALWAGPRARGPVRMTLGVTLENLSYEVSCGLPPPVPLSGGSAFNLDPHMKEESVWTTYLRRRVEFLKRTNATVWARDQEGNRVSYPIELTESETALGELREPHRFPELAMLRDEFLGWRFYHQFRTDADSPIRQPQVGVRTPVLSADGRDLAAALRTIIEIGDAPRLFEAVERAFPGATLRIQYPTAGDPDDRFRILLQMPEFQRPFDARELSDGTLHYLCLLAALLSPRPPALLALNEPETSLHPDLLEPLAMLMARASQKSQLWVTTHSQALAEFVERHSGYAPIRLEKVNGETRVVGQRPVG